MRILDSGKSKYSEMFRKTKVSHSTLQGVLKELTDKEFIIKHDIGHQNVDYEIAPKGRKLATLMAQLKRLTI